VVVVVVVVVVAVVVVIVRVRGRVGGSLQARHIFVSIATMRARSALPSFALSPAITPVTRQTSSSAAHSIAEPRAIAW